MRYDQTRTLEHTVFLILLVGIKLEMHGPVADLSGQGKVEEVRAVMKVVREVLVPGTITVLGKDGRAAENNNENIPIGPTIYSQKSRDWWLESQSRARDFDCCVKEPKERSVEC